MIKTLTAFCFGIALAGCATPRQPEISEAEIEARAQACYSRDMALQVFRDNGVAYAAACVRKDIREFPSSARPLTRSEVRREVKACKATGMVPELVKEQGQVVWIECRLPEQSKAPCQFHYYSDPESSRQPSGGTDVEGCQATQKSVTGASQ